MALLSRISWAFIVALLCCEAALSLDPTDALGQYGRQTWQTDSGLPQNTVSAVLQTRDGYLWLATDGGLVRFDGLRFAVFDPQNSGLRSGRIQGLLEDAEGNLWIATAEGIGRKTAGSSVIRQVNDGLTNANVLGLTVDSRKRVTAQTPDGRAAFDGRRFVAEQSQAARSSALTLQDRSGHVYTSAGKGLVRMTGSAQQSWTTTDGLPSLHITALYLDRENTLWVGTDAGLVRLHNGKIEAFPPSDPLASDTVLSILEDGEGDLWVGTDTSGLTVLRDQKFTAYTGRAASLDTTVRCVLVSQTGAIWMGTDGAGLVLDQGGKMAPSPLNGRLSSQIILSLAETVQGDLLIGTPDGLNIAHAGKISLLTSADGLPEDFIRSLYADSDGSFWVGTRRGLAHVEGNHIANYTQADGLGSDLVGDLLRDRSGDLWIATLQGLTRRRTGTFRTFTRKDGLPADVITDLLIDRSGELWISTQGGGLARRDGGRFRAVPATAGLPATIFGLTEDYDANLWLATRAGIFRVREVSLRNAVEGKAIESGVASYGTSDGLRVRECSGGGHPASAQANTGDIWFAMTRGVAELKASHAASSQLPTPVVIETVSIDERVFPPDEITRVGAGHSRIAFQYAGLSFSAPFKVRYRYRLEGFDSEWVDAGSQRTAYYTNLSPGHYRFDVMARNGDGVWTPQGAALGFQVEPHYYQTWWFRSLLVGLLVFAAYLIYYVRLRQMQAQYAAVLQERNRIAREIHDTLAQGFVAVSVQLEIVRRLLGTSIDAAREQLDETRILVRQSIGEARQSIWELRSHSAENQDFPARLTTMAKQVAGSSGARIQVQVHGTFRPLPSHVEDELFRIAQEAVTNAMRHGAAQCIDLELSFGPKKLYMTIADDGCGFEGSVNAVGPEGHFGLKGMHERAKRIHAHLHVESEKGRGTRISVEAPAK